MMHQLPVPASPAAREYRALEVMEHVPPGCRGVLVTNDRFAPHLRRGEFAVVDIADKMEQLGEIYLFRIDSGHGRMVWRLIQIVERPSRRGSDKGICFAFGNRDLWGTAANMVEGPLGREHWPELCCGRVIGVIELLTTGR